MFKSIVTFPRDMYFGLFEYPAAKIVGTFSKPLFRMGIQIEMLVFFLKLVALFGFWALCYSMAIDLTLLDNPTWHDYTFWLLLLPTFYYGFFYKIPHMLKVGMYVSAINRALLLDEKVKEFVEKVVVPIGEAKYNNAPLSKDEVIARANSFYNEQENTKGDSDEVSKRD